MYIVYIVMYVQTEALLRFWQCPECCQAEVNTLRCTTCIISKKDHNWNNFGFILFHSFKNQKPGC
jgi:hypothetical protein